MKKMLLSLYFFLLVFYSSAMDMQLAIRAKNFAGSACKAVLVLNVFEEIPKINVRNCMVSVGTASYCLLYSALFDTPSNSYPSLMFHTYLTSMFLYNSKQLYHIACRAREEQNPTLKEQNANVAANGF